MHELHANIISALCSLAASPGITSTDVIGEGGKRKTQSQTERQRRAPFFLSSLQLQSGCLFDRSHRSSPSCQSSACSSAKFCKRGGCGRRGGKKEGRHRSCSGDDERIHAHIQHLTNGEDWSSSAPLDTRLQGICGRLAVKGRLIETMMKFTVSARAAGESRAVTAGRRTGVRVCYLCVRAEGSAVVAAWGRCSTSQSGSSGCSSDS